MLSSVKLSQVCRVSLCISKVKVVLVSERQGHLLAIELIWTAKKIGKHVEIWFLKSMGVKRLKTNIRLLLDYTIVTIL